MDRYVFEWQEQVASTMNIAADKAKNLSETLLKPYVIQAGVQSVGRGKAGRAWVSAPGNFYLTILLPFAFPMSHRAHMSFVTGIAVVLSVKALSAPFEVKLKWPNDFYIKTRKLGGVLLEYHDYGVPCLAVGVGLNLNSNPSHVMSTNLKDEGLEIDPHTFRKEFLKNFFLIYDEYVNKGFHKIKNLWISNTCHLNSKVSITRQSKIFNGIFDTIDDQGMLIIQCENGKKLSFSTGEVFFE